MAAINLVTADTVAVVESLEQTTHPCGVDITAGKRIKLNAAGRWALAAIGDTGAFIAAATRKAGTALTGIKKGVMDGFDLSGLAYDAKVYSAASGALDTTDTGGTGVEIGRVEAAHSQLLGAIPDKVLRVDM